MQIVDKSEIMTQTTALEQKLSDLKARLASTLQEMRTNPSPLQRQLKIELQNAIADTAETLYYKQHQQPSA